MPTSSANLGYGSNKLWNWIVVALPGKFACKRGQATAYQKKREKKNPHLVSDYGSGDHASSPSENNANCHLVFSPAKLISRMPSMTICLSLAKKTRDSNSHKMCLEASAKNLVVRKDFLPRTLA